MKKSVVWFFLSIVLLAYILTPKKIEFSSSIDIPVAPDEVFSYMVNLESWRDLSRSNNTKNQYPFYLNAQPEDFSHSGLPGVVGSAASWDSPTAGHWEIKLIELQEPHKIITELIETSGKTLVGQETLEFESHESGTRFHWTVVAEYSNYWRRPLSLLTTLRWKPFYQRSQEKLKTELMKTAKKEDINL